MKSKIPLAEAQKIAQKVKEFLEPYCERIEIAGSVRREKPEVGDIEIVVIPRKASLQDMFGNTICTMSVLAECDFSPIGKIIRGGDKYKQIALHEGMSLDLFIVTPPAHWGVIFLIRTGSAEFSHRMVTLKRHGGNLPSMYRVKEGAVWKGNTVIPVPEEEDYFKLCNMEVIPPNER